jgi:hypothetical protein
VTAPSSAVLCAAWATQDDVDDRAQATVGVVEWDRHLLAASEILFALTGRQWPGISCPPETVYLRGETPRECYGWAYDSQLNTNVSSVGPTMTGKRIMLPRPGAMATAVTIGGTTFTAWRMVAPRILERTDGQPWPLYGDTIAVTYSWGISPPRAGVDAAALLAVELAKNAKGMECALPARLQSVTRQGISFAALDDLDFLDKGLTGLLPVDLWIRSVNPNGLAQQSRVWSPDVPTTSRRLM